MLNKRDEQKCRILVPKSRLIFGICDAWGVLKEGECAVCVTMDGDGVPRVIKGIEVLVTRNPCLHPGDLQKFHAVEKPELAHLVDCIVFPIRGRRPAADLMSGGDLDGDKCKFLFLIGHLIPDTAPCGPVKTTYLWASSILVSFKLLMHCYLILLLILSRS